MQQSASLDRNTDVTRRGNVFYRQLFEGLHQTVRFSEGWVVSSMPRGGLQIVQPPHLGESWLRLYARDFHRDDSVTWTAIRRGGAVRRDDIFDGSAEGKPYLEKFLHPAGLRFVAAAPLQSPVMEGYPGALHIYRTQEMGEFSDKELAAVREAAERIEQHAAETRQSRRRDACATPPAWARQPVEKQFVFDASQHCVHGDLSKLDERVASEILKDVKHRLAGLAEEKAPSVDRIVLADQHDERWAFRVTPYQKYAALSGGGVVFYCLEPGFCEWRALQASDVAADPEVSRLIPAMQYILHEFRSGPSLETIAKTVHLSPFHFHRRFTELLGITPKHLLLRCQIFLAKSMLIAGDKDLVQIAGTCGFAHQSHFTSRFKQATGLTPTRWRRLIWRLQENTPSNN